MPAFGHSGSGGLGVHSELLRTAHFATGSSWRTEAVLCATRGCGRSACHTTLFSAGGVAVIPLTGALLAAAGRRTLEQRGGGDL